MLVLVFAAVAIFLGSRFDRLDSSTTYVDYFTHLHNVRAQIRASDSHLAQRYKRLVESKDVAGLVGFLRNNFTVVPGSHDSAWSYATSERRWGSEATLRGGVGTPREIADLLENGLREMDIDAKIVSIESPSDLRSFARPTVTILLQLAADVTVPDFGVRQLRRTAALPDADDFWKQVVEAIPADSRKLSAFDPRLDRLPTVQFVDGNTTRVANLWGSGTDPFVETQTSNAGRAGDTPWVTVKLEVAMADQPDEPITLATGRWRTEEIARAQIIAGFVPLASSHEALLTTAPRNVSVFVPTLRLAGAQYRDDDTAIIGSPLTISGKIIAEDGSYSYPRSNALNQDGDASRIESIVIKRATTGQYPWVGLDVEVLDANGSPVPEVPVDAFSAMIDGSPAAMLLESNTVSGPGILFLLDVSASVAEEFRGAAASEMVQTIAKDVRQVAPDSRFRVGLASGNGASLLGWRDDIAELERDVNHFGMGSPLWRAAADVADEGATVIVFITDGHAGDREGPLNEPDIDSERAIRAGPPFVMVSAVKPGEVAGPAIERIAGLSGGRSISTFDSQDVITDVSELVRNYLVPYRFLVRADTQMQEHELVVSLVGRDISAKVNVIAPASNMRSPLPGPVGIYLTIQANGILSERTLAGYPYRSHLPVIDAQLRDAHFGLFGEYTLIAEAGNPNAAQILDDLITSRLSWQKVVEATDDEGAMRAFDQVRRLPGSAFSFSGQLPGMVGGPENHRVFDVGLRWWLHSKRRVSKGDDEVMRESVDVLPNTRFFGSHPDPNVAFEQSLRTSGYLSEIERALYEHSAMAELDSRELAYAGRTALPETSRSGFVELTSGWRHPYHFIVPKIGEPTAAIAVDTKLGAAIGLLREVGSANKGAGITEAEANERFDMVDRLLGAAGEVGGSPGAWAAIEKAKMDKLRFATILIITMEPPDLLGMLRDEACGAASDAVGAAADAGIRAGFGGLGDAVLDAIGEYNDTAELVGMGGLESPVSIPGCD